MATLKRSSILLWFQDLFGLQSGSESVPNQVSNVIQPVIEIGPRTSTIIKSATRATNGTTTVYTTPTDKDFYITSAFCSVTKDATSDNVIVSLAVTQGGISNVILAIPSQTTTAMSGQISQTFSYPIKVDRGTNITFAVGFTAGATSGRVAFTGFLLE